MRKVDLELARMACPDYCCKCGDSDVQVKTYSERIALVGLVRAQVPVCNVLPRHAT